MRTERVITRLEHAGGSMTEAIQLAEDTLPPGIVGKFVSINVALADARRAAVRLANMEDPEEVFRDFNRQLRETFV